MLVVRRAPAARLGGLFGHAAAAAPGTTIRLRIGHAAVAAAVIVVPAVAAAVVVVVVVVLFVAGGVVAAVVVLAATPPSPTTTARDKTSAVQVSLRY